MGLGLWGGEEEAGPVQSPSLSTIYSSAPWEPPRVLGWTGTDREATRLSGVIAISPQGPKGNDNHGLKP